MIFFVHGPDALLARSHVKDILDRVDPGGENTTRVDGRSTSPQAIAGMVATPSFFGMARVVVVDDLLSMTSKNAESDDDEIESTGGRKSNAGVVEMLGQVVEPNSLILVEPSLASVPAAIKKAGVGIDVRSGVPPRGSDLVKWVQKRAETAGSSIDNHAARVLLDAVAPGMWQQASRNPAYDVPPDLDAIQQELEKLATFAYPDPISAKHIGIMTSSGTADQLFPFLAALFEAKNVEAVRLLSDAIDNGEDHFRTIAQIYGQAELVAPLEAGRGIDPESIGKDLGISNPRRMAMIARSLRGSGVSSRIPAIAGVDRAQKTGALRSTDDVLFALLDVIAHR